MLFTWGKPKRRSTNSYEPKTPKLSSVSLPDERYTPMIFQPVYNERAPTRNSVLKRFSTEPRTTTPLRNSIQPEIVVARPKSRSRTVSTPARQVEAPRPIRPHPSQGPLVPITEQVDRIRIDSSREALAPIAVPSAAYLEEKLRRERGEVRETDPVSAKYITQQEYLDIMRKRAEKMGSSYSLGPSKAWIEDQEELAKRHAPSAPPMNKTNPKVLIEEENEDIKSLVPIPVVDSLPVTMKAPSAMPLKSALKKTPSVKQKVLEPLYKPREYRDSRAYYSENEKDRIKPGPKNVNVIKAPSKAFLEEQNERIEELKKRQHSNSHTVPVAAPVSRIHSSSFQHTNSSSTGSPTESILQQEYRRSRRISNIDAARPKPSSYMPAYIKETHVPQHRTTIEPHLAWPVVDYSKRRHLSEPLVYFDAGFNPRDPQFEVCTIRQRRRIALTYEERNMAVATENIVITNATLNRWPIDMEPNPGSRRIRVIDVFRAIHDTYAVPLSRDDLAMIGPDYIQRCEPAFLQRCKDSNEPTHYLEYSGMRRIDLLRGRRIFKGLAYTGVVYDRGSHKHAFELQFDRGN